MSAALKIAATAAGAALLVGLAPGAAEAKSRWFADAKHEIRSSVDIHYVRVINGTANVPGVRIGVLQRDLRAGDFFDVWYDTRRANPGPEFRASWVADSDALGINRVEGFKDQGVPVLCPGLRIHSDGSAPSNRSTVYTPRPCLGRPDGVRVSVRASRHLAKARPTDWAPRFHQFYDWVARG